jgi:hypothetical protein
VAACGGAAGSGRRGHAAGHGGSGAGAALRALKDKTHALLEHLLESQVSSKQHYQSTWCRKWSCGRGKHAAHV